MRVAVADPGSIWSRLARPAIRVVPLPFRQFGVILALLAAPAAAELTVEATRLDGGAVRGELTALAPELVLRTGEGVVVLDWSEVLSLVPVGPTSRPASAPALPAWRFALADGSDFRGEVIGSARSGFVVRFGDGKTSQLDVSMVRSIVSASLGEAAQRDLDEVLTPEDLTEDAAVIFRDERVVTLRGSIRQVTPEHVVFAWRQRDVQLPWSRVAGVRFASPTQRGAASKVRLRSGEVFAGRVTSGDTNALVLQSGIFEQLRIPWPDIESIECRSDRVVFLSDLKPMLYEFEPLWFKKWELGVDRSLSGGPIQLGGRTFARGLVMHSRARVVYAIGGGFDQFAAVVGIADEIGARGDVTLRVLGNERELWRAERVRGGDAPRPIVLDIEGVRELTLEVDFGGDLDLADHAVWAFARLIR